MRTGPLVAGVTAVITVFFLGACGGSEPTVEAEGETTAEPIEVPVAPAAAEPMAAPTLNTWNVAELMQRRDALAGNIGEDGSSRETLAEHGNYRFRHIHRITDGFPEQHADVVDVVIVTSGAGTMVWGGEIVNPRGNPETTILGDSITGGQSTPLAAGDVIHIPVDIAHAFLVPEGGHFTYILVKFPPE